MRVGERDHLAPVAERLFPDHRGVRDRGQVPGHHQRHAEDRLERGLVPAREAASGVGGFELRGGDGVRLARGVLVRAAVEAVEPVVQRAREPEGQPPLPRRDRRGEDEPGALGRLVQRDGAVDGHAALPRDGCALDQELGRVERDLGERRLDIHRDDGLAREGGGRQVGLEPEIVALGHDGGGQAVVHGGRYYHRRGAVTLDIPSPPARHSPGPFTGRPHGKSQGQGRRRHRRSQRHRPRALPCVRGRGRQRRRGGPGRGRHGRDRRGRPEGGRQGGHRQDGRDQARLRPGARRAGVEGARRGPRPLQQRGRRRPRRPRVRDPPRLGVGAGRQPLGRHPRRRSLRAAHDRPEAARPHRQHGVHGGADRLAGPRRLQHEQVRRRRSQRDAPEGPAPVQHRRLRALPDGRDHQHPDQRAQPAGRPQEPGRPAARPTGSS